MSAEAPTGGKLRSIGVRTRAAVDMVSKQGVGPGGRVVWVIWGDDKLRQFANDRRARGWANRKRLRLVRAGHGIWTVRL